MSWKEQQNDLASRTIDCFLDIYMQFLILERRIKKEIPAWEGILIVKESDKKKL